MINKEWKKRVAAGVVCTIGGATLSVAQPIDEDHDGHHQLQHEPHIEIELHVTQWQERPRPAYLYQETMPPGTIVDGSDVLFRAYEKRRRDHWRIAAASMPQQVTLP